MCTKEITHYLDVLPTERVEDCGTQVRNIKVVLRHMDIDHKYIYLDADGVEQLVNFLQKILPWVKEGPACK